MRRFIPIFLSLLLLVGCGTGGQAPTSDPKSESSPSSVSKPAAVPTPSSSEPASVESEQEEPSVATEDESTPNTESEDTPETQGSGNIEEMIQKYKNPSTSGPSLADAKPNGMDLYFADGTITHVPIPSSGPGYLQTHATSLRNDAVVIAYDPEDNSDTISIVSTRDKGQSWQSVNLAVENAKKYSHYYLSFQDAEKGILILCGEDGNSGLIYSTENAGTTWSSAIPFSSPDAIYNVTSSGDSYCIAGENNSHPVILQSGDGASWNELILPLDANEYPEGYCTYAVFSGDTGLAVVIGIKAEGGTAWLYFSSEDNGQSWSLYKTGR